MLAFDADAKAPSSVLIRVANVHKVGQTECPCRSTSVTNVTPRFKSFLIQFGKRQLKLKNLFACVEFCLLDAMCDPLDAGPYEKRAAVAIIMRPSNLSLPKQPTTRHKTIMGG